MIEIPLNEREVTVAYLEHERGRWLEYRTRAERSAHMDAAANKREADAMMRLDYLLDELFSLNVEVVDGA